MGGVTLRSVAVTVGILSLFFAKGIVSGHSLHGLKCRNTCDQTGEILECILRDKENDSCSERYYLLCLRNAKGQCSWYTIDVDCEDRDDSEEAACRQMTSATRIHNEKYRNYYAKRVRRENQLRRRSRQNRVDGGGDGGDSKIVPKGRRGLATSSTGDGAYSYAMDGGGFGMSDSRNGPSVSTSGDGHAYAVDGNQMAESHYGSPPVLSTLSSPTPTPQTPYGQHYVPVFGGYGYGGQGFAPGYGHAYAHPYSAGYGASPVVPTYAAPGFSDWDSAFEYPRTGYAQSSPFTNFFHSIGLEDPFLMLLRIPEVDFPRTSAPSRFNPQPSSSSSSSSKSSSSVPSASTAAKTVQDVAASASVSASSPSSPSSPAFSFANYAPRLFPPLYARNSRTLPGLRGIPV